MGRHDVSVVVGLFIILLIGVVSGFASVGINRDCVNVYYDQAVFSRDVSEVMGALVSVPHRIRAVETYQKGDFDKCRWGVYIGTNTETRFPRDFLRDFVSTDSRVIWMGSGIWQLGDQLQRSLGLRYIGMHRGDEETPIFIYKKPLRRTRAIEEKPVQWVPLSHRFKIVEVLPTNLHDLEILAEVRHDRAREMTPFFIRSQNRFYFAGVPQGSFADLDLRKLLSDYFIFAN